MSDSPSNILSSELDAILVDENPSAPAPAEAPKQEGAPVEAPPSAEEPKPAEQKAEEPKPPEKPKPSITDKGAKNRTIESRLKGMEKWAHRLSQENARLREEVQKLTAPADYTEPTKEEIAESARFKALEEQSLARATKEFGEEYVQGQIFAEDSPYRQIVNEHPWVRQRVLNSPDPIYEALEVIREHEFFENYGRDPETIKTKLKEELIAELKKAREKQPPPTGSRPPALTESRVNGGQAPASSGFTLSSINPMLSEIR